MLANQLQIFPKLSKTSPNICLNKIERGSNLASDEAKNSIPLKNQVISA